MSQAAEVSGLAAARIFATGMAAVLAGQAPTIAQFVATIQRHGTSGEAVAAAEAAQRASESAAAAWAWAGAVLAGHTRVAEAYAATPDAGSREFVTTDGATATSAGTGTGRTVEGESGSTMPVKAPAPRSAPPRHPVVREFRGPCPTRPYSGCPGRLLYRVGGGLACGHCGRDAGRPGLVDEPTDAAGIAAYLRERLGLHTPQSVTARGVWGELAAAIDASWMPESVKTAFFGFISARGTGQLLPEADAATRELDDWHLCALVGELAANCFTQRDVPVHLARKYCR